MNGWHSIGNLIWILLVVTIRFCIWVPLAVILVGSFFWLLAGMS